MKMENGNTATIGADGIATTGDDAIEILENDHKAVRALFGELAAGDGSARGEILERLKALLSIHNATEENLVYPAVGFLAHRKKDAETLYHQQDEAELGLWQIDAMLKGSLDGDVSVQIDELQTAVLAHVRKEEQTEFPHLRDALKAKGLAQLTNDVREFRARFR